MAIIIANILEIDSLYKTQKITPSIQRVYLINQSTGRDLYNPVDFYSKSEAIAFASGFTHEIREVMA